MRTSAAASSLGGLLAKALAAAWGGKGHVWPCDRSAGTGGQRGHTHGSGLCWSQCQRLWSPPADSQLFVGRKNKQQNKQTILAAGQFKKYKSSSAKCPKILAVTLGGGGVGHRAALTDSQASSERDGMKKPPGPAGFSDLLPPTCQRAGCHGVLGCTEGPPTTLGGILLVPSVPGHRLLDSQPASPFRAAGCSLSRRPWL